MNDFSDEEKDAMGLSRREADKGFQKLADLMDRAIFEIELPMIINQALKPNT